MSENYDKIIGFVDKYYYFVVGDKSVKFLGSGKSLKQAKEKTLKTLEPKIDDFMGSDLIFVKIENSYDDYKIQKKDKGIKIIGGPIVFIIEKGVIDNKQKIRNEREVGNNRYYLSKKYIKEHMDNIVIDLKKIVNNYSKNKYKKSLIDINIL
jgi:hypothetical protein